jgi:hypothetical protein
VTNGISFGRKTVSGVNLGNPNRVGDGHSGALTEIAGRVASAIAKALRLAGEVGSRQSSGGGNGDPYQIDEIAKQLSTQLGGNSADGGRIARALHEFAQESASLIGARPQSTSFVAIENAIAKGTGETGEADSVDSAITAIDRSTHYVRIAG